MLFSRIRHKLVIFLGAVALLVLVGWLSRTFGGSSEIEYQGQVFRLSRGFVSYEDYKDDPNNLAPSEKARIEQAVIKAPIDHTYPNRDRLIHAVFELKFPGYGLSSFGYKPRPDGSTTEGYSIEIPLADKERIIVFRQRAGVYTLIDDFIDATDKYIGGVEEKDGQLLYSTMNGKPILTRTPSVP